MAAVKNDIRDGLWAEGGSPLFQLDGQLRGTSVARIVRSACRFVKGNWTNLFEQSSGKETANETNERYRKSKI